MQHAATIFNNHLSRVAYSSDNIARTYDIGWVTCCSHVAVQLCIAIGIFDNHCVAMTTWIKARPNDGASYPRHDGRSYRHAVIIRDCPLAPTVGS
jgi:hypothetical protein